MNNFKRLSALILTFCTAATIFASCDSEEKIENTLSSADTIEITEIITEIITEKENVTVEVTDKKGEVSVSVSEKIVTIPVTKQVTVIKSEKTEEKSILNQLTNNGTTKNQPSTTASDKHISTTKKAEILTTAQTTKKLVVNDKINENAVGIFLMTKSDPVKIGNHATVFIQGTPGKTYSIDFYETPSDISNASALDDKKADANGFVSWSFEIRNSCNLGKRKVIIKENNSSNYIETSITVI